MKSDDSSDYSKLHLFSDPDFLIIINSLLLQTAGVIPKIRNSSTKCVDSSQSS